MERNRIALKTGVFVAVALITFLRAAPYFLHPTMQAEDGSWLFAFYYNHQNLAAIGHFFAGYICLLPQLVAFISGKFPQEIVPYIYAAFALLFNAFTFSLFSWERFRGVIESDGIRAGVCVLMALFPIGSVFLLSSTMYTFWNALVILILLSLAEVPGSRAGKVLQGFFMIILIWSNPISVLCVPIFAWRTWQALDRDDQVLHMMMIIACLIYQWLGVVHDEPSARTIGQWAYLWAAFLLERIVFETFVDVYTRLWFRDIQWVWFMWTTSAALLLGMAAAILICWFKKVRLPYLFLVSCFFIVLVSIVGIIVGRSAGTWGTIQNVEISQRYFYVQRFFFLLSLMVLVIHFLQRYPLGKFRVVAISGLVLYLLAVNVERMHLYSHLHKDDREFALFMQELRDSPKGKEIIFFRPGAGFTIRVNKR